MPAPFGPAGVGVCRPFTAGPGVVGTTVAVAGPSSTIAVCAVTGDSADVACTLETGTDTWGTAAAAAAAAGVTRRGVVLSNAGACPLAKPSCLHGNMHKIRLESQAAPCNSN